MLIHFILVANLLPEPYGTGQTAQTRGFGVTPAFTANFLISLGFVFCERPSLSLLGYSVALNFRLFNRILGMSSHVGQLPSFSDSPDEITG